MTASSTIVERDLRFAMEGMAMTPGEVSLRMKTAQLREEHAYKVRLAIGVSLVLFTAKLNNKIIWEQGGELRIGC